MNVVYLDIFSGISGDMFIGAMINLGVDPAALELEIGKLKLPGYHLHTGPEVKQGISGIKFDVHITEEPHEHPHTHDHHHSHGHHHHISPAPHSHPGAHRGIREIREIVRQSALSEWVKTKALAVFQRIAVAEGKIHGISPDEVHFHEVGAIDSIVDIVGACVALEILGKPAVLAGAVVEGTGTVRCAHGTLPLPAPATLEILAQRQISISQCDEPNELITPTGAALLAEFAESFGPMRGLAPKKIGFGLGTRENRTRPNVLRAILCEETAAERTLDWQRDTIAVLETNLDNINPELLGHALARAMDIGALDAFHTPVQMKKNRPGVLFTILCEESRADEFTEFLLRETSALGVRRSVCERRKIERRFATVQTPYGDVTVKIGALNGEVIQRAPEFESCRKLAESTGRTLKEIYAAALAACGR